MKTEEQLLNEATAVARGRSGKEPTVHMLIAQDLEIVRLRDENAFLRRALEQICESERLDLTAN
jgi:hypothetical protein